MDYPRVRGLVSSLEKGAGMKLSLILIIFFVIVTLISTVKPIQDFIDKADASVNLFFDDMETWIEHNEIKGRWILGGGLVGFVLITLGVLICSKQ
jgi:hypothetical protein